jgi:type VI secretion system secreted protein VgrG
MPADLIAAPLVALTSRLDFAALLDQQGRLLKVETALPALALIPERMVMTDAVNAPFELTLDCLSTSVQFELKRLVGEQISLRLLQADGSYKAWHGYVFGASQLGADGGLARYRLTMRPWLSFLAHRVDSFVYQDKTALAIIEDVFKDHAQANYSLQVSQTLRTRSLCTQYRESDLAFVERLLAEEGLSYRFEHLEDDAAKDADAKGHARHVLVIGDAAATAPDLGDVRFARQHVTAHTASQRDAISAFMVSRQVAANAVTRGAWDYKRLAGTAATDASALDLGELPTLEHYDGSGAYRHENTAHAERAAALALAALELGYKQYEGQSSARHFRAGQCFSLIDHPLFGANATAFNYAGAVTASHARPDNQFTLTSIEHHATNNLGAQAAELLSLTDLERGTYLNHFRCVPAAAPLVPAFVRKPTAPNTQTALVVGLSGESLTTDRDHRVKVQFAWQRGEQPNAGGLAHGSSLDAKGNAPGTEASGTWVRVAQPAAGANWGAVYTPRIGTEVSIGFVDGDIDRPVVLGQLYNGVDTPPFAAGADSGVNHPGVISGVHTHSLDQSSFNQWVIDDASGQLRMRLLAGYANAELGLGHLIQQSAGSANRGSWRGAGFEAITQGWVTVHAAKGLLVSATPRAGTYGSAQGTQMDAAEALAQLKGARELGLRTGQAAKAAGGHPLSSFDDGKSVPKWLDQIDLKKDGKHAGPVNAQQALKTDAQGRAAAGEPVEAFASPVVLMESPSAALLATEAGIAAFAGQDLSISAQGDVHQTAAHTWASVTGKTTSWYVHSGGVRAFAANGPVSLRAHTDALQIWADKDVTVISVNDQITVSASSKIEMIAGQSSVTLDGADIEFKTPGAFTVKGSGHAFLGGASQAASIEALPVGKLDEAPAFMELNLHDEWLMPVAGAAYRVVFDDGTVREGKLDSNGHARLEGIPNKLAQVFYGEDPAAPKARVEMPVNAFKSTADTNEEAIVEIQRYLDESERFWSERATGEQLETRSDLGGNLDEALSEDAWHFLNEAEQKAMASNLGRDVA